MRIHKLHPPSSAHVPLHQQPCRTSVLAVCAGVLGALLLNSYLPTLPNLPHYHFNATTLFTTSKEVNIAYFLQVTNSTAYHVPRLINRIHHPQNVYLIHFDRKVLQHHVDAIMQDTLARTPGSAANIHLLPPQIVTYAGFSMVLNTLSAMSTLLTLHDAHPWDYFINLSGSDYPLVTPTDQRRILGNVLPHRRLFMQSERMQNNSRYFFELRAKNFHFDEVITNMPNNGTVFNSGTQNPIAHAPNLSFVPLKGSAWMAVTKEFVEYAINSDLARLLIAAFAHMRASDEHFFIALAYNTPYFRASVVENNLRTDVFDYGGRRSGQHPFNLDEKNERGEFIFMERLRMGNHFHARKFPQPESEMMDKLDVLAANSMRTRRIAGHIESIVQESLEANITAPVSAANLRRTK